MAAPPSLDRMGEITVKVWELALTTVPANGGGRLPPDVAWLLQAVALSAPATAARCPRVLAAVPTEVAAAVRRLAGAAPVTPLAAGASQEAASETLTGRPWLTTAEAARALHLTSHAVAPPAAGAAWPPPAAPAATWRIGPASLEQYRRSHARADS